MRHHLDRVIASDLSQLVLQRRAFRCELGAQVLDSSNQSLYPLPSQFVQRHAFFATTEGIRDSYQGEPRLIRGQQRHG